MTSFNRVTNREVKDCMKRWTINELAAAIGGELVCENTVDSGELVITGIASLEDTKRENIAREDETATPENQNLANENQNIANENQNIANENAVQNVKAQSTIAFVADARMKERARASGVRCLIVGVGASVAGKCCIEVANPKLAFARIAALLQPSRREPAGIDETALIHRSAQIDANVFIGANVIVGRRVRIGRGTQIHSGAQIGDDVTMGEDCVISARVVLYDNTQIANRVVLHAGAVIGADGFGFVRDETANEYVKFPQIGRVVIEDDVEIGANSCVDRAALGETRIGQGTKIDNLVQIGHNVSIGKRVVIAAQTGISGSVVIEDDCVLAGQVGIADHVTLKRGAIIGAQAGVPSGKIIRGEGRIVWGTPARPLEDFKTNHALVNRLPKMREELERLKQLIEELVERNGGS